VSPRRQALRASRTHVHNQRRTTSAVAETCNVSGTESPLSHARVLPPTSSRICGCRFPTPAGTAQRRPWRPGQPRRPAAVAHGGWRPRLAAHTILGWTRQLVGGRPRHPRAACRWPRRDRLRQRGPGRRGSVARRCVSALGLPSRPRNADDHPHAREPASHRSRPSSQHGRGCGPSRAWSVHCA
jgi:hypothetical protein